MPATPITDSFKALMEREPGRPEALVVTGEVRVPTTGWTAALRHAGHGHGRDLHLMLVSTPPGGAAGDIVETLPVTYREAPPRHPYDRVTIRAGEDVFSLAVPVLV